MVRSGQELEGYCLNDWRRPWGLSRSSTEDWETWRWLLGEGTEDKPLSQEVIRNTDVHIKKLNCPLVFVNTSLCWQRSPVSIVTGSGGRPSTNWFSLFFYPQTRLTVAQHAAVPSLLIKSDNTLVTVMLAINHTGRGGGGVGWKVAWWAFHPVSPVIHWLGCLQLSLYLLVLWEIIEAL